MEKLNLDKKTLRKFGITMGAAFFIIAFIVFIRHKDNFFLLLSISAIFFILSFSAPLLLKPVYISWMRFAFILSWVNTRLILFIIFYLIFTPIGLALRLFKVDLLDRKIDKQKETYWKKMNSEEPNPLNYERQF